ncbi:pentapeptide repeat-containing protein [Funiculus sociatus]
MADETSVQELQVLIQRIVEAQTDNLDQLATIAGLNLSEDFAEADLRGADLRGGNLRGADLRGTDLKGAALWGADLR